MNYEDWEKISAQKCKANVEAAVAQRAMKAGWSISTFGMSDEDLVAHRCKCKELQMEYIRLHKAADELCQMASSMYRDKAGSDVEFYRKYPLQSGEVIL
jgi:Uri superfamily endonuclease